MPGSAVLSLHRWVLGVFTMSLLVTARCTVDEGATGPLGTRLAEQQSDSIYWINNELTFEYEGDDWRVVRDQQAATEVEIYQSEVLVNTI